MYNPDTSTIVHLCKCMYICTKNIYMHKVALCITSSNASMQDGHIVLQGLSGQIQQITFQGGETLSAQAKSSLTPQEY